MGIEPRMPDIGKNLRNGKEKPSDFWDVIIIGSGVAGLMTALHLPTSLRALVVTKDAAWEGSTYYAQGGIAAAVGNDDSPQQHASDTLIAGAGHCTDHAVNALVEDGVENIRILRNAGMPFDTDGENFALTREGAHGQARIVHAGGDATGKHLSTFLLNQIKTRKNITLMPHCFVTSVEEVKTGTLQVGINNSTEDAPPFPVKKWTTSSLVLATGGCGWVYPRTTNPVTATGDGFLLATQLNLAIHDMEFHQFHPTALVSTTQQADKPVFLISESVRGEGGLLLNVGGERFMQCYDPRGELAPRDVVTRAIWQEMKKTNADHVLLDVRHLPEDMLHRRFPTIRTRCREEGILIETMPIPVAPAAHYHMGGIVTDIHGRTSHPHVYAVGEIACTGVHGANRLASNSLLEGIVFGKRVAAAISKEYSLLCKQGGVLPCPNDTADCSRKSGEHQNSKTTDTQEKTFLSTQGKAVSCAKMVLSHHFCPRNPTKMDNAMSERSPFSMDNEGVPEASRTFCKRIRQQVQTLMWEKVGIIRKREELEKATIRLRDLEKAATEVFTLPDRYIQETHALLVTAKAITAAALERQESLGAHFIQSG